jgi:ribonuclease D
MSPGKLPFPKATYIRTPRDLHALATVLAREPLLAIDTESNSLYAYRERVCLMQISTRSADYIVDPIRIVDLEPVAALLSNPAIEKVFHAAEYDLILLRRDFGFTVNHLFDTMLAARICGYKSVGLSTLLFEFYGIELDKSHQRDDWGQRPLPADSLLYAQMDTHHLPKLRDDLAAELKEKSRWEEALEIFEAATHIILPGREFDPEGFWRLATPNQLTRRETAILRELYLLREKIAEEVDLPPYKIMADRALVQLAQIAPHHASELYDISGAPAVYMRDYGRQVLQAIRQGEQSKPPAPPRRASAAPTRIVDCYTLLREWRKQRAIERGVESDVIIPREALWVLANRMPATLDEMQDIPGLGPWRLAQYGEALLDILKQCK